MKTLIASTAMLAVALPSVAHANTAEADPVENVIAPLFEAVAAENLADARNHIVQGAPIHAMFNPTGATDASSIRTFPAVAYFGLVTQNYENIVFSDRTYSVGDDGKTVWMEANGNLRLEATGTPYLNRYVFKFTLNEDQKITEIREWVNTVTLTQQGIAANQ